MVNLKTKSDKHLLDNEKRRQSIKEKEKTKLNQSQIIKQALSNTSLSSSSSKKIIFNDDGNVDVHDDTDGKNLDNKKNNGQKNCILFGDSESEEETPTITEKVQFSGKKGFELLNLQSTYGNDERFKIDERFLDRDEMEEDTAVNDDCSAVDHDEENPFREKKKMLNILESVLDEPVTTQENTKAKKREYNMIRYDASKKEHEIYEITPVSETTSSKKKRLRKLVEGNVEVQPVPQVSKEKFYEVSGEIKNSFKEKEGKDQFSLLQAYGTADILDEQEIKGNENEVASEKGADKVVSEQKVVREREKKESKELVRPKEEEKQIAVAQGIWKESFFFEKNDSRFKDCLDFINKKNSTEAIEAAENYDQIRKKLKEILRLHMKKQLQKKDPFRNKIGGRNKMQLANTKLKNNVMLRKKKPFKKNPVGKI